MSNNLDPGMTYEQGFEAFIEGTWEVDDNPYDEDEGSWGDWNQGWEDARDETSSDEI